MTLASSVPSASSRVFCHAEPRRLPRTCRPPDTVNSANSRMMNGRYSASSVCATSRAVTPRPKFSVSGTSSANAQNAVVFPKW